MNIERIKYERTGGFAGIRLAANIEMDKLPDDQKRSLLELLDDLDFEELPENLSGTTNMADGFVYSITIESKKRRHTVVTGESAMPEKMQSLIEMLDRMAKKLARNH
jgi:hypothetical protein